MADRATIEDLVRECAPRVLGVLARRHDDFGAAEDAVQEALLAATQQWPLEGIPTNPVGWLVRVAGRRLVDAYRSDRSRADRERLVARTEPDEPPVVPHVDDTLTVLFLCCHPALTRPSQVALTLRAVAGLTTAQIARGFLVPESTMAQRISRAKARLAQTGATFGTPADPSTLTERVGAVLHVIHLIFTEGHASSAGATLRDPALTGEAIRLVRLVLDRRPEDAEAAGLLALMLLTEARAGARTSPDGSLVPLADQDRSRWDRELIAEGIALVESVLARGSVGPFQLQAAIAAVHAEAPTWAETDWLQIVILYRMLEAIAPSPAVTLNLAVAVSMVHGPTSGLRTLEPLLADASLAKHHRLHAVRAHLLEEAGDIDAARGAYALAARLTTSTPEQRYLNARLAALPPPIE